MDTHGQIPTDEVEEIWKDIVGYPDYQVSNYGNVRSFKSGMWKYLKTKSENLSPQCYPSVCLYKRGKDSGKSFSVHRLVAEAFKEPPSPELQKECRKTVLGVPIINHIDGDRHNNRVENLEWCTYSHNNTVAYGMGRIQKFGDDYHLSVLTKEKVLEIVRLIDCGITHKAIAELFGVSRNTISSLNNGYSWSHVTGRPKKVQKRRSKTDPISE
ncbi:HNH endonuclease [Escherichia coli]|nr:HNH endonuclease [Escherichia coli]